MESGFLTRDLPLDLTSFLSSFVLNSGCWEAVGAVKLWNEWCRTSNTTSVLPTDAFCLFYKLISDPTVLLCQCNCYVAEDQQFQWLEKSRRQTTSFALTGDTAACFLFTVSPEVLSYCQVWQIPAVLYQCYTDVIKLDTVTIEAFKPVLSSKNLKSLVKNLFIPEVEEFCRENDIPFKITLIVDNAPGDPAHLDSFHPNVKVVFLPLNTTSILQPMDQGVIANFKAYSLRSTFAQAVVATDGETGKTLYDFQKSRNIYQAIINIAQAWAEVTQVCLNAIWKKVCPQFVHSFKGFKKDETYEEVADEIVKLAEQLQLEVDVDDVDEIIESHEAELSNEDLMEFRSSKSKRAD
ncbi:Proteasome assembly chaperone 1 [Chelonia mydas]|uniref:Proteasome assembly chaperone 1 n=1 Tax=Chelonia mydas TaxID=8469 RepID=M7B7D0_CHEMY|nr:Proteasome assembly chaperone 1 [Chelonia mydas]